LNSRDLTRPPDARDAEIPSLTGLRFIAAISVVVAHGGDLILKYEPRDVVSAALPLSAAFGMTLFFVLSGFVIHYNYRHMVTARGWGGLGAFLWARFARLYPLFLFMLVLDVLLGRKLFDFMEGNTTGFTEVLRSLPYYLLLIQSWVYVPFADNSLIYVTGVNVSLTWSISTEWFFYLAYPAIAVLVLRARRPWVILVAMLVWSLLWGGMASVLDGSARGIDSWATLHYGSIAGVTNGVQDSFIRWLEYFSPYLRIGEFILGCLTAQLFLQLRDRPVTAREQAIGQGMLAIGIASVPLIILLTYTQDYRSPLLFSLRDNYGLAPSVAVILFGVARYQTALARILRGRLIVALGEASYSIYLIHFLVIVLIAGFLGQALPATLPNIVFLAARFAFVLALICLISLGLHAVIEVPSRRWLRGLWGSAGTRRRGAAVSIAALPAAAALLCLALLGLLLQDESEVVAGVRLISATYGANCGAKHGNATRALAAACDGQESCDYSVEVARLGDPAAGCSKDFTAEYACMPGNASQTALLPAEAGFGSHALLACTATAQAAAPPIGAAALRTGLAMPVAPLPTTHPATGIDILSATYGGNCNAPSGNATADIRGYCGGKASCSYSVEVSRLGDPANGCQKDFTAEYACMPGSVAQTTTLPAEAGFGSHALLSCTAAAQAAAPPNGAASPRTGLAMPVAPLPTTHPATGIDILSATYGGNCNAPSGNATADIRGYCSGKASCSYSVEVSRLGDPANGCQKDFTVAYRCPGNPAALDRAVPAEAGFGASVELSCP
jgi:peptidoglycan/LPS O-acetylase OafA/YrhL